MILKSRSSIADIANALDLNSAVEIGTHQGVFACDFLDRFRGTLSCVDPWYGFDENPTFYPAFDESSRDREVDYSIAVDALSRFGSRVSIIRLKSVEALGMFDDNSVGLVYVDGLHDYDSVAFDTFEWFRKVSAGGIIAGHDYRYDYPGVVNAVNELRRRHGLCVHITDESMPSWWAIKQ